MVFPVRSEKEAVLRERMQRWGIRERDLKERFVRSGGKGGQRRNKTATCVYLKHLPSGIEVKIQQERSQGINRFLARRVLVEKIERHVRGKASQERQRIEKIRRQKKKRSRRAKEKILRQKRLTAQKKALRAPPPHEFT